MFVSAGLFQIPATEAFQLSICHYALQNRALTGKPRQFSLFLSINFSFLSIFSFQSTRHGEFKSCTDVGD